MIAIDQKIDEIDKKIVILVGFTESEMQESNKKLLSRSISGGIDELIDGDDSIVDNADVMKIINIDKNSWITIEEFKCYKNFITSITPKEEMVLLFNNKYEGLYPFSNSVTNIEDYHKNLFENNDYSANEKDEKLTSIYTIIRKINDEYYVGFDLEEFEKYTKYDLYSDGIELDVESNLSREDYDYSIEFNNNSEAFVELNQYLNRESNKIIVVTLPLENKLIEKIKVLACIYNNHTFLLYSPSTQTKLINNEESYLKILNDYWGYDGFRDLDMYKDEHSRNLTRVSQAQIIDEIVNQMENAENKIAPRDIFVTSSTGAGKSIMFQLPTLFFNKSRENKKLTIVISPLIGLMNDQVSSLSKKEINNAKTINSGLSPIERKEITQNIKDGKIDILYISIETLINSSDIQSLIGEREIGLFVVDEAHTVTTWGRTFRVDYWYMGMYLNKLRKRYNFPIVTFTATAIFGGEEDMYTEIKRSLNLVSPIKFIGKVKKDNIFLKINPIQKEVKKEKGNDAKLIKDDLLITNIMMRIKNNQKMLVYFPTIKGLTQFKRVVDEYNLSNYISVYYSHLTPENKELNFEYFKNGKTPIMLATKAFGMGIDIEDIEYVHHYAITGNVLDYIQEIGRAARQKDMKGFACLDYLPNKDFNDLKMLRAISSIKKYQLIEVMNKIKSLYNVSGNKRYLNVNVESFNYIFNDKGDDGGADDIESKLKLALLNIENDFKNKLSYPPFTSIPNTVNSREYVLATEDDEKKFKSSRYRKYFSEYNKLENPYYTSVYEFKAEDYWKDNYHNISFRQFKYFLTQKPDNLRAEILLRNLRFTSQYKVTYQGDYSESSLIEVFDNWITHISNALRIFATRQIHFTDDQFARELKKEMSLTDRNSKRLASTILSSLLQTSFILNLKGINITKAEKYNITNDYEDLLSKIKEVLIEFVNKRPKNDNDNVVFYYILKNRDSDTNEIINIGLGLLEVFGMILFEIKGGSIPTLSLRINSISLMEKYINNPQSYNNKLLDNQYKSYLRSIEMLKYLYTIERRGNTPKEIIVNYTKDFWHEIEEYFFGNIPEQVNNEVNNKLYSKSN